jgi:hypothetical protein
MNASQTTSSSSDQEDSQVPKPHQKPSKISLAYDVMMVVFILVNLFFLAVEYTLNSNFSGVNQLMTVLQISLSAQVSFKSFLSEANAFFTIFLIVELSIRWIIAIVQKHYYRWFFFPFVHWYEVLGCLPILRPLRLLRAAVIAYRLYVLGYAILPRSWIRKGQFYYELVLEELSDRIVIRVIDGITTELKQNKTHYDLVEKIIQKNKPLLIKTLLEILEKNLPAAINQNQAVISQYVSSAVERSLQNTPELQQILHLMPVIGNLLSNRLEAIGARLGENIAIELMHPLTQIPNPLYAEVANQVGNLQLHTVALETLVDSIVVEALQVIRDQVSIQQWKAHESIFPNQTEIQSTVE